MMKKLLCRINIYIIIILICILISGCTHLSNVSTNTDINTNTNADIPSNISDCISKTIFLSDDKKIEYQEWVDEDKTCYRVAVRYKEEQTDRYTHCEDYFFFVNDEDIMTTYVDYSKEKSGADRYVWNACDFEAYLEDVTFDGNPDLVISLGHAGAGGDLVYCAYVYKDGEYVYAKSFESIVNYKLDNENKCIVRNGDSLCTYIYDGNSFVEK